MLLLDRYESLGVLGAGSMGQVHAARPVADPATTVVVKVLRPDVADTPKARQFFEREVAYTARLKHAYAVRMLDAGVDPVAGPCLVMEFVPGTTLESILDKERRLELGRAAFLLGCLCHGLQAAHTAAVIHRDLKPANLMVVNAGQPTEFLKVMDFGLAQLASKPYLSRERLAGSTDVVAQGTPAYISPEQLRGDDVDGRADLYSTGVILFEMLTGRHPFPYSTVDAVVKAHLNKAPPKFADVGCHDFSPELEQVVQRCLAKFPAERPACPYDLAREFGRVLDVDLWNETAPAGEPDGPADIPLAEDVPAPKYHGPNTFVRLAEAWMPERIAVIKLGGFLRDLGGDILASEPGVLKAEFAPPTTAPASGLFGKLFGGKPAAIDDGISLELLLEKPNPAESKLAVTAVFRVPGGGRPQNPSHWAGRCQGVFDEMRKYLMAGG